MRKIILVALTLCFTGNYLFSQESDALDKGFEMLRIDAKLKPLQKYLISAHVEELRHPDAADVGEYLTSGWLFDFKTAGFITYHGLVIQQIEVYFNLTEADGPDDSEAEGEDIFSFHIYLDKPKDSKTETIFTDKLFALYGDTMLFLDEESSDVLSMTWFSSITLLDVFFGKDVETGDEHDFYLASFHQAYGG